MSNGEEEASNMINDHFIRESENQFILRVVKESKLEIKNRVNREIFNFISNVSFAFFAITNEDKKLFFIELKKKDKWFHFEYSFHFL